MTKCPQCKQKYPDHLVSLMLAGNDGHILACPICALDIRNSIHGLPPDTPFTGELAAANYDEALEFLRSRA